MSGPGWIAIRDEISALLTSVSKAQMQEAASLFGDRGRRWFCAGQGRSGLVARMAAMRLMHLGFPSHALGEATAPSVQPGDGLMLISASGETPTTLHVARLGREAGAEILAVTAPADSTLASLAGVCLEIPATGSRQFGGSLFEQGALLALDGLVLEIARGIPDALAMMESRHANLQ